MKDDDEFHRLIGPNEPAIRNLIVLGAIALIGFALLAAALWSGAD